MSWSFDKVDDLVPSGNENVGVSFSIGVWVYPISLGESSNGYIVALGSGTPASGRVTLAAINTPNANSFQLRIGRGTDGVYQCPVNSVVFNVWQYLLFTYDGSVASNDPLFYYNGQPMTLTRTQAPIGSQPTDGQVIYIGNSSSTSRTWDGLIGELGIWPGVLSAVEVACIYLKGARVRPDYTLYYPGDYANVNASRQQFPAGHQPLTLSNGVVSGEAPPTHILGVRG